MNYSLKSFSCLTSRIPYRELPKVCDKKPNFFVKNYNRQGDMTDIMMKDFQEFDTNIKDFSKFLNNKLLIMKKKSLNFN